MKASESAREAADTICNPIDDPHMHSILCKKFTQAEARGRIAGLREAAEAVRSGCGYNWQQIARSLEALIPGGTEMSDLMIPVKGVYFDQIRNGTKLQEYRLVTDHWRKRLQGRAYHHVVLTRGYPKSGGVEGETRLTREWRGFTDETLTHEHFGPDPVRVFAIDVSTPVKEPK